MQLDAPFKRQPRTPDALRDAPPEKVRTAAPVAKGAGTATLGKTSVPGIAGPAVNWDNVFGETGTGTGIGTSTKMHSFDSTQRSGSSGAHEGRRIGHCWKGAG